MFDVLELHILFPLYASEEEKESGKFSPELNSQESESHGDGEFNYHRSSGSSSALCFQPRTYSDSHSTRNGELCDTAGQVESHDNGTTHANCDRDLDQIKPVFGQVKEQVSVTNLLCTACKLLLFRPVVLNCGHGMLFNFSVSFNYLH